MATASYALWGLLGGAVVEALDLANAMRPTANRPRWALPWADAPADRWPYLLSVALRLGAGAGLAAAVSTGGAPLDAPYVAFLAGLGAPVLVERLLRFVKVAPLSEAYLPVAVPLAVAALLDEPSNASSPVTAPAPATSQRISDGAE